MKTQSTQTLATVDQPCLIRPCERPVVCCHATYSPERVNKLASSAADFAAEIEKCNTLSDAKALAEAVRDNWKRFWASC